MSETLFTLTLGMDYSKKFPKGFEVEIDKFEYNPKTMHILRVRVTNMWKRPTWMSASWFSTEPEKYWINLKELAKA